MQQLFLRQSYQDCEEAFRQSLCNEHFIKWDYVILTASNMEQAESYRMQIAYRMENGYLPAGTHFAVLEDPDGKRVGSGGATLNVLRFLADETGGCFAGKRILVIHSGGDSKRIPQYSACGKIFSPVPRSLSLERPSTLFDEFMISMAGVAGRLKEGMVVLSGDVLLLFNPLQIDFSFRGAAALSMKEPVEIGREHGVFLNDGSDYVGRFLHKQPISTLRTCGAVNDKDCVDLDTGAVALDVALMQALYGLISSNGRNDEEKFARFVNEKVRLSFYGDFLYPLATKAALADYEKEAAEGELCEELLACRRKIWDAVSGYSMRLISLTPAEFIHFGTTGELLQLLTKQIDDYAFLGWKRQVGTNLSAGSFAVYNSLVAKGAAIGSGAYVENSILGPDVKVGNAGIVSGFLGGLSLERERVVFPAGTVFHGLLLKDGRFCIRVYEVEGNPKDACREWMNGTILQEVGEETPLWNAEIYPVCQNAQDAVRGAMITLRMMRGAASVEEKEWWQKAEKLSLEESFALADEQRIFESSRLLEAEIQVRNAVDGLSRRICREDAMAAFAERGMSEFQWKLMEGMAVQAPFSQAIRLYDAMAGQARKEGRPAESYEEQCFAAIKQAVYESGSRQLVYRNDYTIKRDEVHVELPVRVNWGGGWTDTPPQCLERGGTVINAALRINGILPIQITLRKMDEYVIETASEDVGAFGRLTSLEEIRDCSNPYDAFALHKAALLACGVFPLQENGETLEEILKRLGGGLFISTQVIGIPKGSGLGTSSILAGACVKAVFDILGLEIPEEDLYKRVLCAEQLMSTGGGWQDQVGGLVPGIKFITSEKGIDQNLKVQKVEIPQEAAAELEERFALIYTGQRRLARNLLRDVVGGYISGRKESLDALYQMERVAALMRFELEKGNIDELAGLFNIHWNLSVQLDEGSTNTCIEQIFRVCEDLVAGKFIAGAGGGGFLQVILKKGVTKAKLRARLQEVFQDSGVDVWDSSFYWQEG